MYEGLFKQSGIRNLTMTGNSEKLPRRERERLQHKDEILSAALKLFSEKGFHNVSMQEIATEAEFATGTLYNFFPSKEALFDELADGCAERIISSLNVALEKPGNEVEKLRTFIRYQPQMIEENADFIRLYVSEVGVRGTKLSQRSDKQKVDAVLNVRLSKLLKAGIDKGIFRCVDPDIATQALTSLLETIGLDLGSNFDMAQATEIFAKVEELFLDGLLMTEGKNNE